MFFSHTFPRGVPFANTSQEQWQLPHLRLAQRMAQNVQGRSKDPSQPRFSVQTHY